METIIPDGYYQYDPSTGQIALLPPYNSITKAQVKNIYNLLQHQLLYDCRNSPPEQYITVSTVDENAIITHRYSTTGHTVDDILQITIDSNTETSSTTVDVNESINIISSQTISASGTLDTGVTSTTNCAKLDVYFSNTGTSTDVKITVHGSPTSDKTISKTIGTSIQLGASDSNGPVIGDEEIPGYLWFSIVNNDPTNSAIITITVDKYVVPNGYTQSNITLFSSQIISAYGTATSIDAYTAVSKRVNIYCTQTGASTNTTFYIYGKSRQSPNISKQLATCNLGSNEQWGCGILQDVIPGSIYATVSNGDSTNSATATVLVESFT